MRALSATVQRDDGHMHGERYLTRTKSISTPNHHQEGLLDGVMQQGDGCMQNVQENTPAPHTHCRGLWHDALQLHCWVMGVHTVSNT
eukprot:1140487-Pelagomonas_calceolata.AAC.2